MKYSLGAFLDSIQLEKFETNQYYAEVFFKSQLYFHFTVSGEGTKGDINWWSTDPKKIATCIIIDDNGTPHQLFSTRFWCHHLGVKASVFKKYKVNNTNLNLNRHSIGFEMDSWGPLLEKQGEWYPIKYVKGKAVPNISLKSIPREDIVFFDEPFRGFNAYEKFTDEQIEMARWSALYCNEKYDIPLDYNSDMWDVSENALNGVPGIWTHVSVRPDKQDCMPQPEFVQMLKSLT